MNHHIRTLFRSCIRRPGRLVLLVVLALLAAGTVWAAPLLRVTKVDALLVDNDGDGRADPGDTLRYTVIITNSGDTTATQVQLSDTLDPNTTLLAGSITASPVAVNDTFAALGNVSISPPAGALTANDFGLPTPAVFAASGSSTQGGAYEIFADGSFTYAPPRGYRGADTFAYTLQNSAGTDTATVTVNISGMIWFINNAAGGAGDGTLAAPFTSLDAFRTANTDTGTNPRSNDSVFIYESGTTYTLSGVLTLHAGQRLIGQDATTGLATLAGVTVPPHSATLPAMNAANATVTGIAAPSTSAVVLGTDNRLHGFTLGSAGTALSGTTFGTLTVDTVTLSPSQQALNLETGTANSSFTSITSAGGANGIRLANVGGTLDLGGGALSGATAAALTISGGSGTFTYTGTITAGTGARSVAITNKTGGAVTFSGAVSGTGTGVYLNSNGSAPVTFSGGVNLNTGANRAFEASGSGVVTVTGTGNVLQTTSASALYISNVTLGAGGLTFRSISSNGGSEPGIYLNNTGATGGLTVTGTGTTASSGGTIANKSGADGAVTAGIGISLHNTRDISLANMKLNDFGNFALYGTNVTNFTLTNTVIDGVNGSSDVADEAAVAFYGLYGVATLTDVSISGGYEDNVRIVNTSGTLNRITFTRTTFGLNHTTFGNDGLLLEATNPATTLNATLQNCTFTGARGDLLQTSLSGGAQMNLVLTDTSFANAHPNTVSGGGGVTLSGNGALTYAISGNTFRGALGTALTLASSGSQGAFSGRFENNTIGVSGTANSGSAQGSGLALISSLGGTHTALINNNTIQQYNNYGILVQGGVYAGLTPGDKVVFNTTVTNNTIQQPGTGTFPMNGFHLNSGTVTGDNFHACIDLRANALTGTGANAGTDFRLRQRQLTTVRLPGYGGANNNDAAVVTFVQSQQTPNTPSGSASNTVATGGGGFTGGGACAQPAAAAPGSVPALAAPAERESTATTLAAAPAPASALPASFAPASVAAGSLTQGPLSVVSVSPVKRAGLLRRILAPLWRPTAAGELITVGPFDLPAGKQITVTFDAVIANPVPAGIIHVSNQGQVQGSNFTTLLSDDPDTAQAGDPTLTSLDVKADLALTKSDGGISVTPGSTLIYTLAYTNAGPQPTTGVVLTDTVPAHTTFNAGASTPGWTCANGAPAATICTLAVGQLAVDGSGTAAFAVDVVTPVAAGVTQLANTATLGSVLPDPVPGNNSATDTTPVDAAPDLRITKSDNGVSTSPGGTVVYTLTVTNAGTQGATGVVITDTVPAHTTFSAASSSAGWSCPNGSPAGTTCTLNAGALAGGGATAVRTFAVTVIAPAPAGVTQLSNTATVADDGANGADPTPANNSATDTTPVDAAPDLRITKSDNGVTTTPGGTVVYTLTVTNAGTQGATGVVITDTVPVHTTFSTTGSSAGWSCPNGSPAGTTCTLTAGALAGGGASAARTFAVTVANPVLAGVMNFSNTATVADDGTNGADPTPGNNSATDTTPVSAYPDLDITKSDGGLRGFPGATIVYTLTISNAGNRGATGIQLQETVPVNATFSADGSSTGWSCANGASAGTACTLSLPGSLAGGGATLTRTFAVRIDDPFPLSEPAITNTVTVSDDGTNGADPVPANNRAEETTPVDNLPNLSLSKSDGGVTVVPGDTLTYTLVYTNVGGLAAFNAVLTETVPAHTTFNAGAGTPGWSCSASTPGSTCTLDLGTITGQTTGSAHFAVTVDAGHVPAGLSEIRNTATVGHTGNGLDPDLADNTASTATPVDAAPDLHLAKSDGGSTAIPGGTVAYTLTVTNAGTQGATGIVLTDTVPAHTIFSAAGSSAGWSCPNGSPAGTVCTLSLPGELAGGGANAVRTFAVTVVAPVPAGVAQLSNTATIADDGANGADPTPTDNSATDTTPVDAAPDLRLAKTDGDATTTPGDTVVYTLTVTNAGNRGAMGMEITETVPAHTTFDAAGSSPGWVCAGTGSAGDTCTLNAGALAGGGATAVRTFAVTVIDTVPAGVTQLSNTATVADDGTNGADPTPGNNSASDTTPVDAAPDLRIAKSDNGVSTTPGGTVVYTLTVTNAGTQDATGVEITETVPAHTTFNAAGSSPGWSCATGNPAGTTCTLTVGALAGGGATAVRTFAVTVIAPAPAGVTQLSNTAVVADDGTNGADPTPANNSATDTTPLDAVPDLRLTKSDGGATTTPGGTVAYALTVTNAGNQGATGVVIVETVPALTTFNAAGSSPGWACTGTGSAGDTCTLNAGALAGGGATTVRTFALTVIDAVPAGVTQLSNSAAVADDGANGADPTPGNNSATDTTPLDAAPDLTIVKDDGGESVVPGTTLVYTLTPGNAGNQGATGVVITETVPAHTTFSAPSSSAGWSCPNGSPAGTTCTFALPGELAGGGGSAVVAFALVVESPVPLGVFEISNTAEVADDGANGADTDPGNNSASDTTPLILNADLWITKTAAPAGAPFGQTVTYTLAYGNDGPESASGVRITDLVPAALTGLTYTSSGAALTPLAGPAYSWQVAALHPGDGGTITVTGVLTRAVIPGPFDNTAVITGTITDPVPGNNQAVASVSYVNTAPIAAAGPDQRVLGTLPVTLDGTGSSDPDGHLPLTFGWTQAGGPPVLLSSAVVAQPTFTAPAYATVLTFTLTVTDAYGLASSNAAAVVITVDDAAILNLQATNSSPTVVHRTTTFTATAEGANLTYTWSFGDAETGTGAQPVHTYTAVGVYTAVVTATNGVNSAVATTPVTVTWIETYLPLVLRRYVQAPDLVVEQLTATAGGVQVVIRNAGNAPVVDPFWVDLYINPHTLPTSVNQIWNDMAPQGLVWGVTTAALPLAPGDTLTLTVGDAYYVPAYSKVTWPLPFGTPVYAQVDSAAAGSRHGAVLETHEISGDAYNNIAGTFVTGAWVAQQPQATAPAQPLDRALPPR